MRRTCRPTQSVTGFSGLAKALPPLAKGGLGGVDSANPSTPQALVRANKARRPAESTPPNPPFTRGGKCALSIGTIALTFAAVMLGTLASAQDDEKEAKKESAPAKPEGKAAKAPDSKPAPPPRVPSPIYTKTPTTPIEFWDAADYLMRTGQAEDAVPYLNQFLQSNPDDATLLEVRDRYGAKSIFLLQDNRATRAFAEPIVQKMAEASRRHSTNPERIARFIGGLMKSQEEQDYAVERLREAGPFAIPALVQELGKPSLSSAARALLVRNIGRLDRSTVPALIAVLDAAPSKPALAADVATALGQIGDPRAIPALTITASLPASTNAVARDAARRAVEKITGRPFDSRPKSPARTLVDEARRYHVHAIRFPSESVLIWVWDDAAQAPAPKTVSRSEAEAEFGVKLAKAALAADPSDRAAQAVFVSLILEKAAERVGFTNYPANDPANTFSAATAAGPAVLGDVLRQAIADGKMDLAAVAANALGKVTETNALAVDGHVNPLVEALSAPSRRVRFAAARALVNLDPRKPFAGSSRVVPVLAQFLGSQEVPRALVIDGNLPRGSQQSGFLKTLGYEPVLEPTGQAGFKTASESADIELILIDHHMISGSWRLHDILANLRADARTAGLPLFVVGPLDREADLFSLQERFPGVKFIVTPTNAEILKRQLQIGGLGRSETLTPEERAGYARESAALLAQVAGRPNSPFERDLSRIESTLTAALANAGTQLAAVTALGDVPRPAAQRGLADVLLDSGQPAALRLGAARELAKSIQRFGPLVAADQEPKLLEAFGQEADPALRTALGSVVGALRPRSAASGARLRQLESSTGAGAPTAPVPPRPAASSSPEAPPAAPAPEDK